MGSRTIFAAFLFAIAQTDASCATGDGTSGGGGGGTATTSCPIPAPYKVDVSSASPDISSIEVQAGDDAEDKRQSFAPWCDTTELTLTKLDVATEVASNGCPRENSDTSVPCDEYGMLVALEIEPTPIRFPIVASRPELVYDLQANPPQKECAGGCLLKVFQLRDPRVATMDNWRFVADAVRGTSGSIPIATANIDHFSVFALVELPDAQAVAPGAADAQFIVASAFIAENQEGAITVQLAFVDGSVEGQELEREISPLFRFDRVDPVAGFDDPACAGTPAEILTCLFPEETEIRLQLLEDGLVSLGRVSDGYRVDFSATVEIF